MDNRNLGFGLGETLLEQHDPAGAGRMFARALAIGADDDFFSLGGDSVLATAAVGQIRQWLDAPAVMVADIFATRTVATLAALLRDHEGEIGRAHV